MPGFKLSWNDAILFGALGYSGVILTIKWSAYAECARPIHVYLLVDYLIIALFRIAHLVSKCVANQALWVQKTAEFVKVGLIYSFFVCWTVVGTVWFAKHSSCLPDENQYWSFIIWLVVSYTAIVLYLFLLVLQFTLRSDQNFLHIGMFGRSSMFPVNILSLADSVNGEGLPIMDIHAIPVCAPPGPETCYDQCPICIDLFKKDDMCKKLPDCVHVFHSVCIDGWLLRKRDCPICRTPVSLNIAARAATRVNVRSMGVLPHNASGGVASPPPSFVTNTGPAEIFLDLVNPPRLAPINAACPGIHIPATSLLDSTHQGSPYLQPRHSPLLTSAAPVAVAVPVHTSYQSPRHHPLREAVSAPAGSRSPYITVVPAPNSLNSSSDSTVAPAAPRVSPLLSATLASVDVLAEVSASPVPILLEVASPPTMLSAGDRSGSGLTDCPAERSFSMPIMPPRNDGCSASATSSISMDPDATMLMLSGGGGLADKPMSIAEADSEVAIDMTDAREPTLDPEMDV